MMRSQLPSKFISDHDVEFSLGWNSHLRATHGNLNGSASGGSRSSAHSHTLQFQDMRTPWATLNPWNLSLLVGLVILEYH